MSLHGRILNSLYLMLIVIFFYYDQNILNSICVRFNRNLMIEEKSLNNLKEVNKSNKNKTTNDKSLPHNYQTHAVTNINQIHIFNFWRKKTPIKLKIVKSNSFSLGN